MLTHRIKIYKQFADAILSGEKTFEVRYNDRGYQKGDTVIFTAINPGTERAVQSEINSKEYLITYVLSGNGIDKDYVVFGIVPNV